MASFSSGPATHKVAALVARGGVWGSGCARHQTWSGCVESSPQAGMASRAESQTRDVWCLSPLPSGLFPRWRAWVTQRPHGWVFLQHTPRPRREEEGPCLSPVRQGSAPVWRQALKLVGLGGGDRLWSGSSSSQVAVFWRPPGPASGMAPVSHCAPAPRSHVEA